MKIVVRWIMKVVSKKCNRDGARVHKGVLENVWVGSGSCTTESRKAVLQ